MLQTLERQRKYISAILSDEHTPCNGAKNKVQPVGFTKKPWKIVYLHSKIPHSFESQSYMQATTSEQYNPWKYDRVNMS